MMTRSEKIPFKFLPFWLLMVLEILCPKTFAECPDWVNFPGKEWKPITPKEAGLNDHKFNTWVASRNPKFGVAAGGQKPGNGGAVITRGGYILHTWGDPSFKYQTKSLGKIFTKLLVNLTVYKGLIKGADDLIKNYLTGDSQLNGKHK